LSSIFEAQQGFRLDFDGIGKGDRVLQTESIFLKIQA